MLVFILLLATVHVPLTQSQSTGDLRLVGRFEFSSSSFSGGRLEIYIGRWVKVCNAAHGFNFYEGDIACKQLGFLYANEVGNVGDLGYPHGGRAASLYRTDCSPFDNRLINCSFILLANCNPITFIAVECSNSPNPVRLVSDTGRTLQLSSGRLEIFINDVWGTVCSHLFSKQSADVACRQLGFPESNSFSTTDQLGVVEPNSSVPVWLGSIECTTSSDNLRLCSHSGTGQTSRIQCSHNSDVILSCRNSGNLRLIDSSSSPFSLPTLQSSGRLEIYFDDEWGTVCMDSFSDREADVACRQLGFSDAHNYGSVGSLGFSEASSSVKILLDDVTCSSYMVLTLLECSHRRIGTHDCDHSQDVALVCSTLGITSETNTPGTEITDSTISSNRAAVIGGAISASFVGVIIFTSCCGVLMVAFEQHSKRRRERRQNRIRSERQRIRMAASLNTPPTLITTSRTQSDNPIPPSGVTAYHSDDPASPTIPVESTLQQLPPPSYVKALGYPSPAQLPPVDSEKSPPPYIKDVKQQHHASSLVQESFPVRYPESKEEAPPSYTSVI